MNRFLQTGARPLTKLLRRPSFRYSARFGDLQSLLSYSPQEAVLSDAMHFAEWSQLHGDYLEFGVYHGARFASAFHFAQRNDLKDMHFYAFDSFQGLPEITGVDAEGFRQFEEGEFSSSRAAFDRYLRSNEVDLDRVHVVSGWYHDVLNAETKANLAVRRAAIVWVDCDLYESTVPVLDFISNYVDDGTVIVFDDWFCFRGDPRRGERRAFTEWLERNDDLSVTEFQRFGWHGNSFIVHR